MKYLIGIDLGTTNSTISCVSQDGVIETLAIPQFIGPGTQARYLHSLPFFIFPWTKNVLMASRPS